MSDNWTVSPDRSTWPGWLEKGFSNGKCYIPTDAFLEELNFHILVKDYPVDDHEIKKEDRQFHEGEILQKQVLQGQRLKADEGYRKQLIRSLEGPHRTIGLIINGLKRREF